MSIQQPPTVILEKSPTLGCCEDELVKKGKNWTKLSGQEMGQVLETLGQEVIAHFGADPVTRLRELPELGKGWRPSNELLERVGYNY